VSNAFSIIGHTLGINIYNAKLSTRKKEKYLPLNFYRNYYCYGYKKDNDNLDRRMQILKNKNLIKLWEQSGCLYFLITERGINLFKDKFIKEITNKYSPLSKSKEKYSDYLHSECSESFSEWLGIRLPQREYVGSRHNNMRVRLVCNKRRIKTRYHKFLKYAKAEWKQLLK
jgi:hypothetical protein